MDGETLYSIGELARRTGLTVKTIRFYSDSGIVPPAHRSPAGYRQYHPDALARLDLVRTLRDLGIDLATVRKVLGRQSSLPEVAAAHADALGVQIRTLRLRRAVLQAVARRGATGEEMDLMHRLAKLSDAERRQLISAFIDDTFGGLDANPELVALLRSNMPDLPEDPTPEQVHAWVELAELAQDPDFQASVRRMAEYQAAERAQGDTTGLHHDLTEAVRDRVGRALAAGVDPTSPGAAPVLTALMARYAQVFDRPDDANLRRWVLARLEIANDPRVERYWRLLAVINGWPVPETLAPVFDWFVRALRAQAEG
ncbi:MerR family transcriptional regulator [Plantactinospora siamensis]|uniref:MerR family transcriptional regulator n=1 Tax=Plantactinospora siamensis TaxID=555372 RepID=A0ABV6NZB1_9ACTN